MRNTRCMFSSPMNANYLIMPSVVQRRLQPILKYASCIHTRFHNLHHAFAALTIGIGMVAKSFSDMRGSAPPSHITTQETALALSLYPNCS